MTAASTRDGCGRRRAVVSTPAGLGVQQVSTGSEQRWAGAGMTLQSGDMGWWRRGCSSTKRNGGGAADEAAWASVEARLGEGGRGYDEARRAITEAEVVDGAWRVSEEMSSRGTVSWRRICGVNGEGRGDGLDREDVDESSAQQTAARKVLAWVDSDKAVGQRRSRQRTRGGGHGGSELVGEEKEGVAPMGFWSEVLAGRRLSEASVWKIVRLLSRRERGVDRDVGISWSRDGGAPLGSARGRGPKWRRRR